MADFDSLIQKGNQLRRVELGSPRFEMWADDVREAVRPFGDRKMKILERALQPTSVLMEMANTCNEEIDATIELLLELKQRSPEDSRAQDELINQKQAEARATLQHKFNNITVNGDATFGPDSPITKVTVSEFMAALIKEVEAMPESEGKHKILDNLKTILANPTFAAVSGSAVAALLTALMLSGNTHP